MKTREKLLDEVSKKLDSYSPKKTVIEILGLVIEACEKTVGRKKTNIPLGDYEIGFNHAIELTLKNLKKLKSK